VYILVDDIVVNPVLLVLCWLETRSLVSAAQKVQDTKKVSHYRLRPTCELSEWILAFIVTILFVNLSVCMYVCLSVCLSVSSLITQRTAAVYDRGQIFRLPPGVVLGAKKLWAWAENSHSSFLAAAAGKA